MSPAAIDDDRTLVAKAQAGDRAALDALLRRHYDRVHAICRRIAGATRDADDAAQEAMIAIVRGLPRFDGRAAFTTWLYRIATNAALDQVRKRKRRPALHLVTGDHGDDGPPEQPDPIAHRTVEAVADRLALDTAIAGLPEDFRTAVVLRDVGDLDYSEIAATLDIPVGTVKSRIARGRAMLMEALADTGNRDGGSEHRTTSPNDGSEPPAASAPPANP